MIEDLGEVYVLSNPSLPGILKIGFTARADIEVRVEELSKSTAIPLPFKIEFNQAVENPQQYERLIHARFSKWRVAPDKEFFKIDTDYAIEEINEILNGTRDCREALFKGFFNMYALAKKYPNRFEGDWDLEKAPEQIEAAFKKFKMESNSHED